MSSINTKKTPQVVATEIVKCNHCRTRFEWEVKFHYEERPERINGNLTIPLKLISVKAYDMPPPMVCSDCKKLPRCKDCGIILCELRRHTNSRSATENAKFCEGCYLWRISKQ